MFALGSRSREKDLEDLVKGMLKVLNKFELRHVKKLRFRNAREKREIERVSGVLEEEELIGLTVYDELKPRIYLKAEKNKRERITIFLHEILHGAFPNATEDYCYRESERLYDLIYKNGRKNG